MERLSVTIITRNEEKNLDRCLSALQGVADEIVVVDAYSSDRTVEICESYGCKVTSREFTGFGSQRQYAAGLTSHAYVLSLDADEVIDPQLRDALLKCKQEGFSHRVYNIKVTNYFCGSPVKHSGMEPSYVIRLFNKRYAQWNLTDADDAITFPESVEPAQLEGSIHHYRCSSIGEYIKKENRLVTLKARMIASSQASVGPFTPRLMAIVSFVKSHVVHRAWLDGDHGFTIARRRANTTFEAYRMARHMIMERKHTS